MNTSKQHLHIRILRINSHELDGMIASAVVVLAFTSRFTPCKKKVVGFDSAMEYFYLKLMQSNLGFCMSLYLLCYGNLFHHTTTGDKLRSKKPSSVVAISFAIEIVICFLL